MLTSNIENAEYDLLPFTNGKLQTIFNCKNTHYKVAKMAKLSGKTYINSPMLHFLSHQSFSLDPYIYQYA
jgi:hypothetical protein